MPKSSVNPNRRLNSFRNLLWLRKEMKLGLIPLLSVCSVCLSLISHSLAGRHDGRPGRALEGDGRRAGDDDFRLGLRLGHRVRVRGDEEPPLPMAVVRGGCQFVIVVFPFPLGGRVRRYDEGAQVLVSWAF